MENMTAGYILEAEQNGSLWENRKETEDHFEEYDPDDQERT